ncbi:recombinase family protein [Streptomyces sp. NPDC048277]|uniref:recombinase family protein n=1 Tax=Streptomyces sp. NPDC048277 TaxID=3155027 RepID=UPI0033EE4465
MELPRADGVRVTLVVHEHKRLGLGIELTILAEELQASDVGLKFLTGELQGSLDPSGFVFTMLAALFGMERAYIRDRTLEGHESARQRGMTIGGAGVTDDHMLSMALRLRDQEMSLRDIAARLVITTGKKKGQHPSPATVMRMLREHDEQTTRLWRRRRLAALDLRSWGKIIHSPSIYQHRGPANAGFPLLGDPARFTRTLPAFLG